MRYDGGSRPPSPNPLPPKGAVLQGGGGFSERARGATRPSPYITPSLTREEGLPDYFLNVQKGEGGFRRGRGALRAPRPTLPLPWQRGRDYLIIFSMSKRGRRLSERARRAALTSPSVPRPLARGVGPFLPGVRMSGAARAWLYYSTAGKRGGGVLQFVNHRREMFVFCRHWDYYFLLSGVAALRQGLRQAQAAAGSGGGRGRRGAARERSWRQSAARSFT